MDRQRERADDQPLPASHHHHDFHYATDNYYDYHADDHDNYDGANHNHGSLHHHHRGPNNNDILIHEHDIGGDHYHTETLYDLNHVYHGTVKYGNADHNHDDPRVADDGVPDDACDNCGYRPVDTRLCDDCWYEEGEA